MRCIVLAIVLAGCSSKPPRTGGGAGSGAPPPDAAVARTDAGAAASLTRAQCDEIIDRVVQVMSDELKAQKPEDEWPTDDQLAEIRAQLAADFMDECLGYEGAVYDCMMAAPDSAGFAACAAEPAP